MITPSLARKKLSSLPSCGSVLLASEKQEPTLINLQVATQLIGEPIGEQQTL